MDIRTAAQRNVNLDIPLSAIASTTKQRDGGQSQQQARGRIGNKHKIIIFPLLQKCGILNNAGQAGTPNTRPVSVASRSSEDSVELWENDKGTLI
jgi:hypothetical protein